MQQVVDENLYIIENNKGSEEEANKVGKLIELGAKLQALRMSATETRNLRDSARTCRAPRIWETEKRTCGSRQGP